MDKNNIVVLGGGSFGTAIANISSENDNVVHQWMRDKSRAEEINLKHENTRYMPGYKLNEGLTATDQIEIAANADLVFFSVPSKSFRDVIAKVKPFISEDKMLVSTTKGIEGKTFKLMSQILAEEFPRNPIGVLSGPNLAKEIGNHQLTATVIASDSANVRAIVQDALGCKYFRVYANTDTYGVELGGALKNIYAIISGMASALGLGENTKSMLITRSLAEMSRFAESMGANPLTFLGLAGVGDLIVTCTSPLSRNFRVGYEVGKGKTLKQAVEELGEVAEGVNTLEQVKIEAEKREIYMPLVAGLYAILFDGRDISEVISQLMLAQQSTDVEFVLTREEHMQASPNTQSN